MLISSTQETEESACQKLLWNNSIMGCQKYNADELVLPFKLTAWQYVCWLLSRLIIPDAYRGRVTSSVFVQSQKHTEAVEVHKNPRIFWITSHMGNIVWVAIRWYSLPQGSYTKHSSSASEDRSLQPEKFFYTQNKFCLDCQCGDVIHKMFSYSMLEWFILIHDVPTNSRSICRWRKTKINQIFCVSEKD